jgi:uroporphyrinogen-III synthase
VHLSAELPLQQHGSHEVLYPASAKAGADLQVQSCTIMYAHHELSKVASCGHFQQSEGADANPVVGWQDGLAARGVQVVRLNTYTTRQVTSISTDTLQLARQARVLAIASPSAVKYALQLCPHSDASQ